jgi:phosphoadenosine phosphosulfate reductase
MSQTLSGKSMAEIAIERLREFCPPEGYWVAYSGGKDSDVVLDLVRRSGVKYDAHHNLTTCDPPEVVRHVKEQPDVAIERPELTMWQLVRKKQQPPRRISRYCCEILKERGGPGRIVVTGVRWSESTARANRRMVEACYKDQSKRYLHVIIDWSTSDVWAYIRARGITTCSLYAEGQTRVGCVLCPMTRNVEEQIARWPQIARAWERAIKATWKPDNPTFESPEQYWQWWLNRDSPKPDNEMPLFCKDDL